MENIDKIRNLKKLTAKKEKLQRELKEAIEKEKIC